MRNINCHRRCGNAVRRIVWMAIRSDQVAYLMFALMKRNWLAVINDFANTTTPVWRCKDPIFVIMDRVAYRIL